MKILLVAYYFPPDSSSGSFRPLFFANYLAKMGDEITVLTARQSDYLAEQTVDDTLLDRIDSRISIQRTGVFRPREWILARKEWLKVKRKNPSKLNSTPSATKSGVKGAGFFRRTKDFVTFLLATPDPQIGWLPLCVLRGLLYIRKTKPDVILATGGPWTGLLCGCVLRWFTGVPLVVDFRDPWVAAPGRNRRGPIIAMIDAFMERRAVNCATLLIANTNELRENFLQRYPRLSAQQAITVTNGFEDYLPSTREPETQIVTLTHAGDIYASRNVQPILEATKNAIERGLIDGEAFKLKFVGGFEPTNAGTSDLLASPALLKAVQLVPRVGFEESLRLMTSSDVLVVFQPGFPLQIPRKLYDYISARRPVLCISEPGSATWSMVENWSLGVCSINEAAALEHAIVQLYRDAKAGQLQPLPDARCNIFKNEYLTQQLRTEIARALKRVK